MTASLYHRGPDAEGCWVDLSAGLGLGHRRLSILDLSADGIQPMRSCSGRYVIVFNGEIYNFRELRERLVSLGHSFRGRSDTEVLLASFEQWGVFETLKIAEGMFAIAVWDNHTKVLCLARDRVGEKPLYYMLTSGELIFSSEIKGLQRHPGWTGEIDPDAVCSYFRIGWVSRQSGSIYQGVRQVAPGSMLSFSTDVSEPIETIYWSVENSFVRGQSEPIMLSRDGAICEFGNLFQSVIRKEMVADVPIGVLLSGGIDSSLVAATMQRNSACPINTFTIGFESTEFNEADQALEIAKHIGSNHTELYVSENDLLNTIPLLPQIYDEPFADPSAIPTALICRLARKKVTVCLAGDGGDELFGGYPQYVKNASDFAKYRRLPGLLRNVTGHAINRLRLLLLARSQRPAAILKFSARSKSLSGALLSYDVADLHSLRQSLWDEQDILRSFQRLRENGNLEKATNLDPLSLLTLTDLQQVLPDLLLKKTDRAAMAASLETRLPFLHGEVIEFAARLPSRFKVWEGSQKWLLRELLYRVVPRNLVDRRKKGFSVPLAQWLRGPLREWGESLLESLVLGKLGMLNQAEVKKRWTEHQKGVFDWHFSLWQLFCFLSWQQTSQLVRTEKVSL
jgi:asparagine synthase (glutamine-hydrolysing)